MKKWIKRFIIHSTLLTASLISIFPVIWILSTSLKPEKDIFDSSGIHIIPKSFTLDNYIYVLTNNNYMFLTWFKNSLIIALITTAIGIFLSTTAAYALSRYKFFGHKQVLYSFLLTQMFPGALLVIPLYNILNKLQLLNSYAGLILAYSTVAVPFCVWMLKGFFDTIPYELEEAAKVDGLGPFGTFWRIILPLSLPGIAVTGFYSFITAWNEFLFALTFMSNEESFTLPIGLQQFINQFNTDWHFMSAGAIIITLPVLIFFFLAQKWLVSGLTTGGTKG